MLRTLHSTSGTESVLQFYTRQIDMAFVGITPFLMARAAGVPIQAVGIASQFAKSHAVIARNDWQERSPLRIGVVWGSTAHLIGYEWSRQIDIRCLFLNLPIRDQLGALRGGFLDAIACWDPHAAIAERDGFRRVFDATMQTRPSFNFICASEEFIKAYPIAVRAVVDLHNMGVRQMLDKPSQDFAEYIATIFDSRLPPSEFLRLLQDHYRWPDERYFEAPQHSNGVWQSIDDSIEFLGTISLVNADQFDASGCFGAVGDTGTMPEAMTLGYSDSLMCAPFHTVSRGPIMAERGITLDGTTRRTSERLARLDTRSRRDLVSALGLIERDVNAAVMKIGAVQEALVFDIYSTALPGARPTRVSAALTELERNQVIPPRLIAGAHFVRALRNAATHDASSSITRTEAERSLTQLLDLIDYLHDTHIPSIARCRRCNRQVQSDWIVCPACGLSTQATCKNCAEPMRMDWRVCPRCGVAADNAVAGAP
jgi:ABC-type taurine transport system substrate-binding protein/RNA polymerase subunit RPABC4/transcription elongation factor Spt4